MWYSLRFIVASKCLCTFSNELFGIVAPNKALLEHSDNEFAFDLVRLDIVDSLT